MALHRSYVAPVEVLRARKRLNDAVRSFFDSRGLLEVETPIAVVSPGVEPHLVAFETVEVEPNSTHQKLFLQTSPEYAMKRMLGRGVGDIYQIARVFRNGERSKTHAPEFTMLEWYRCPGALPEIVVDTIGLIEHVADAVDGTWHPSRVDELTVSQAFVRAGLADPLEHQTLDALQHALSVPAIDGDTWEDVFFRAFLERIEPTFASDTVTILSGYPRQMAALARIDPVDPRRAERFEVYVGALELANAFGELTDVPEQRRRFESDLFERARLKRNPHPIDEGLLEDLANIPSAAGIALGLDRLLMLCLGLESVQDVINFSPRESG